MWPLVFLILIGTFKFLGKPLVQLLRAANSRVQSAMRPATQLANSRHFKKFMLFFTFVSFQIDAVSVEQLLIYCEFLHTNSYSPSAIVNALAGIKSRLKSFGFIVNAFADLRISYFIKSLRLHQPLKAKFPCIIVFCTTQKNCEDL